MRSRSIPLQVGPKTRCSWPTRFYARTTVGVRCGGGLRAKSNQTLPAVTSGLGATATGPIRFTAVLKIELCALNNSVSSFKVCVRGRFCFVLFLASRIP